MADRARRTFPVYRTIADEVAELELPVLVKLGFAVDGGDDDQREHLWFMVHDLGEDSIDGTLVNQPLWIDRLSEGHRGTHQVDLLSDWTVLTPFGPINPHAFHARQLVAVHREEMLARLGEATAE